ncbi:MAG: BspA family leucine-rich repeat surface protein [Lachnospiraceae bacterium]|nr:BspA family leucine-rich repeat surface protein [Lachnospiraceae bacterium]
MKRTKWLSLFLALTLVIGILEVCPVPVFAEDNVRQITTECVVLDPDGNEIPDYPGYYSCQESASPGDWVDVYAFPNYGFLLEGIFWGDGETFGPDISKNGGFVMWDEDQDVVVRFTFRQNGNISLAITRDPDDQIVPEYDTVVFSVDVVGIGIQYQWQYMAAGSSSWNDCPAGMEGYNEPELFVEAEGRNGYRYRCVCTDVNGAAATSAAAELRTYGEGETPRHVTMSVVTLDADGNVSEEANGGQVIPDTPIALPGDTVKVFCLPASSYRVDSITWGDGADITDAGSFTMWDRAEAACVTVVFRPVVADDPRTVTLSAFTEDRYGNSLPRYGMANYDPELRRVTAGGSISVSKNAYAPGETVTVNVSANAGYCVSSIKVYGRGTTDITQSRSFVMWEDAYNAEIEAYFRPIAEIALEADEVTIVSGGTAVFRVSAYGDGLTYQWQYRTSENGSWQNCTSGTSGYNTAELCVTGTTEMDGYEYRCRVTDAGGTTAVSGPVRLSVEAVDDKAYEITPEGTLIYHPASYGDGDGFEEWRITDSDLQDSIRAIVAEEGASFTGSMQSGFSRFRNLRSVDLSKADTGAVTDMSLLFNWCDAVESIDMSGMDTSGVTNMSRMFYGCGLLTELDITGLDTQNVTDMSNMFANCSSLAGLNVSGLDTSAAVTMANMFGSCASLTELDVTGFVTSNAADMSAMFAGMSSLTSIDVSGFDTGSVTTMERMFANCTGLTVLDLSGFDMSGTPGTFLLCSGCSSLQTVRLPESITYIEERAFGGCSSLSDVYYGGGAADWNAITIENGNDRLLNAQFHFAGPAVLIVSQPQDQEAVKDATAVFTVGTEGPATAYQWQYKIRGKNSWYNCSAKTEGHDQPELHVVAALTRDGYQYRCVITDDKAMTVTSDAATLTVVEAPVTIVSQPQDQTVTENDVAHFTVVAEGENLTYQWQYKIAGKTKWYNSSVSTTGYNMPELEITGILSRNGYQYRCVINAGTDSEIISEPATLTVALAPAFGIISQPQDVSIAEGETADFAVVAEGEDLTYKWQYKIAGSSRWRACSSATAGYNEPVLHVVATAARNGFAYR